jgi:hypothetical protein
MARDRFRKGTDSYCCQICERAIHSRLYIGGPFLSLCSECAAIAELEKSLGGLGEDHDKFTREMIDGYKGIIRSTGGDIEKVERFFDSERKKRRMRKMPDNVLEFPGR